MRTCVAARQAKGGGILRHIGVGLLMAVALWFVLAASPLPVAADAPPGSSGRDCVICHATPGLEMVLPGGKTVSVYVDPAVMNASAHGGVLDCTACHPDITSYPHNLRSVVRTGERDAPRLMRAYTVCGSCHPDAYRDFLASNHAQELAAGNADSAVCSDCHGHHDIASVSADPNSLSTGPAVTRCGACHAEQYDAYRASVHGKGLLENGDAEMPACVDCHGIHNMGEASTVAFRKQSPDMCAGCHGDKALMARRGLSTNIMETYVADFHGATTALFAMDPARAPKQAVCIDCHGTHDIVGTTGASSPMLQERLVAVCQECHPDAGAKFPAAWIGHYPPTMERAAPVFWVRALYTLILTGVVGALTVHVGMDMWRVVRDSRRPGK